jgi:hypothetical protein
LNIETGRYKLLFDKEENKFRHLRVEERLCNYCQSSEIEDKLNLICKCNAYDMIRMLMFRNFSRVNPEFSLMSIEDKFVSMMKLCWKDISNFISDAWDIR